MSRFFSRFDKSYFILVPVVLYPTWPWLTYRLRPIIPFLLFCLWLVCQKKTNGMFFQKRMFSQMCMIAMVFFVLHTCLRNIFALFDHGQFFTYGEFATFLSAIIHFLIVHLSFKHMKFKEMEFLTIVALIGISLAGIAAVRGGMIEGFEGGRLMTTANELIENMDSFLDKRLAYQIGSANYGTTYGFAMFTVPLLWAIFKIKKLSVRLLLMATLAAIVLTIKNSGLGTPVFVFLFGTVLILSTKIGLKSSGVKIIGIAAIVLLTVFAYKPQIFSSLGSAVEMLSHVFPEGSSIHARCVSVSEAFSGDQSTYAYGRYQLQRRSFDVFLDHPMVGIGIYTVPHPKAYEVGGHSHLLDRLGQSGMIGGFLYFGFLIFLYLYYKQMTLSFGFSRQWLLVPLICIFTFIFSCIANPLPTFPVVLYYMVGLPLLALKYDHRNENIEFSHRGYPQSDYEMEIY